MSLYKTLLKDSWRAFCMNKKIWLLGAFLMMIGTEGGYALIIKNAQKIWSFSGTATVNDLPLFINTSFYSEALFAQILNIFSNPSLLLITAATMVVLFLFAFLIFTAQATVIAASTYKKPYNLKKIWLEQRKNFWCVLSINAVLKISAFIAGSFLVSLSALIINAAALWSNDILILLLFIVFTPVGIFASFATTYSIAYKIVGGEHVLSSIKKGVAITAKNSVIQAEAALIIFILSVITGLAAFIISLLSTYIVSVILAVFFGTSVLNSSIKDILGINFIVFILLSSSILEVYIYFLWGTLFQRLNSGINYQSKSVRIIDMLSQKNKLFSFLVSDKQ